MKPVAHIHTDFPTKFGIPRQSGIANELHAVIIFEPQYAVAEAVRGIELFSHLWLIWDFSKSHSDKWSPLVRPPRLGGNTYVGVFASRSPNRPNSIGLSSVKLDKVEFDKKLGPILHISGADLMDGTPIYDIKPYLPYTDSHPDASMGFAPDVSEHLLSVDFPNNLLEIISREKRDALIKILSLDPRPSYHKDSNRIYGINFGGFEIKFKVDADKLAVTSVYEIKDKQ